MKKAVLAGLAIFLLSSSSFAYYTLSVNPGQKKVGYFFMPDQLSSDPSSSLIYHQGIDNNLTLELTLTGYRSWYLLTPYTYQLGAHGNQKIFDAGGLKFTGIAGVGGLYAGNVGLGLAFDFGMRASFGDAFALLILPSFFSDGVFLTYGAGYTIDIAGKEITLGGRGNLTLVSSEGRFGFSNRFYGVIGVGTLI